jgi:hypothetical protein
MRSLQKIQFTQSFHLPKFTLVPSPICGQTVISNVEVSDGEFLCEIYGHVSMLEELDDASERPAFTKLWIPGTPLMIDMEPFADKAIYTRIRRSLFFNCIPKLFEVQGKTRVGLFAIGPSLVPLMEEIRHPVGKVTIREGDEILLPFDVIPVIRKFDCDWRMEANKWMDIDIEMLRPRSPGPMVRDTKLRPKARDNSREEERQQTSEGGSLVSFLRGETELCFSLTPSHGTPRPIRPDLPRFLSQIGPNPKKPPREQPIAVTFEPPIRLVGREAELPPPSVEFQVIRDLARVRPAPPWTMSDDLTDVTDDDLRH